jgi:1,2-diacylglycerol 3-alpha-glucosyltransferase
MTYASGVAVPASASASARSLRVAVLCSGLGRTQRGYEATFTDLATRLRHDSRVELRLYGGGELPDLPSTRIPTLDRSGALLSAVGRTRVGRRIGPYRIEEASFYAFVRRHLSSWSPDLVYLSDVDVGRWLQRWRNRSDARFRVLFRNGSGAVDPGFPHWDGVQQLTPGKLAAASRRHPDYLRQYLLPTAFSIPASFEPVNASERAALRARLGLPLAGPVVVSVGALNAEYKRLDYVIEELARLPHPRPHLLVLGQQRGEPDAPQLIRLAAERLGSGGFTARAVPQSEVHLYLRASNVSVLGSLWEGFGRVLVEAMAEGLPTIGHDRVVTRWVLGEHGFAGDLSKAGALAALLQVVLPTADDSDQSADMAKIRHDSTYARFSWDRLHEHYIALLQCAARGHSWNMTDGPGAIWPDHADGRG